MTDGQSIASLPTVSTLVKSSGTALHSMAPMKSVPPLHPYLRTSKRGYYQNTGPRTGVKHLLTPTGSQACSSAVPAAEALDSTVPMTRRNGLTSSNAGNTPKAYIPAPAVWPLTLQILVQEALARLEIKEQRIKEAYENEVDTLEEYKQNKLRLKAERETLLADAERLRQQASQTPEEVPSKAEVMRRITNIYELISNPDVDNETKGNALRSVVKKIVFDRKLGRFSFHYYIS